MAEPTRDEIERRVVAIVAAALDIEEPEVKLHSSLIDDLGGESIDFLDIRFRLETEFDTKIDDEELWQGSLLRDHSELLDDGGVTESGVEALRASMPDFNWGRFPTGVRRSDLPRLITPRTVVEFLVSHLGLSTAR